MTVHFAVQDVTVDPPHIPIFCVGSRDFLSLSGLESTQPLVFQHKDEVYIVIVTHSIFVLISYSNLDLDSKTHRVYEEAG